MIKYFKDLNAKVAEKCCGSNGKPVIKNIMNTDEMYGNIPLYALIKLGADDAVGYHIHEGDMEMYTIIKGTAIYNDNGTEVILKENDTAITYSNEGHAIKPMPCTELEFIACIIKM